MRNLGFENVDKIKRLHLRFLKYILTPNFMMCRETGRYSLNISIISRIISFCGRLVYGYDNKLCRIVYKHLYDRN